MNIVNVSLMRDLTVDLYELIPDQIKNKINVAEIFGDLQYSYSNPDNFEIGSIVVVPLRSLTVVGRIESVNENPSSDIEYKEIVRKLQ